MIEDFATTPAVLNNTNSRDDDRIQQLECRNEELELAALEMQSVVQELRIQYAELEARNHQLGSIRHELEVSNGKYKDLFELAPIGHLALNQFGNIQEINEAGIELLGYAKSHVQGGPLDVFLSTDSREVFTEALRKCMQGQRVKAEVELTHPTGRTANALVCMAPARKLATNPRITHITATIMDISPHREVEEQLRKAKAYLHRIAQHDPLTDLPNRLLFGDRLRQALLRARRHQEKVALLYMDVDKFKSINDTLGHQIGDLVLCEVSRRIKECLRGEDTVARLGGDEFVVLLEGITHAGDVERVAKKILDSICEPMNFSNKELCVSSSIGIAVYPDHATNAEELTKCADAAMYSVKQLGRNNIQRYDSRLVEDQSDHCYLTRELREALAKGQLHLVYQPQIDNQTQSVVSVEALCRWTHPTRGEIPPSMFIRTAEESGILDDLTRWVLGQACATHKRLRELGMRNVRMAVNISPVQLMRPDLETMVVGALRVADMEPQQLELEVTESALLSDPQYAIDVLSRLKQLGIQLTIDDFGTGYSSLSRLRTLPISRVKIDRSFVEGVPHNEDDRAITSAIISMAHQLHLEVVSEGVETLAQHRYLTGSGCDLLQGFHIGRPMREADLAKYLVTHARTVH